MAKRILIVDDSPIILAACRHALLEAGYEVEIRTGIDDLGDHGADGFDLILMDVQMPELFGDDVASVLRHQREIKTRIYLFSSMSEAELSERVKEAQVDGYIWKGAGASHVVDEVKKILG